MVWMTLGLILNIWFILNRKLIFFVCFPYISACFHVRVTSPLHSIYILNENSLTHFPWNSEPVDAVIHKQCDVKQTGETLNHVDDIYSKFVSELSYYMMFSIYMHFAPHLPFRSLCVKLERAGGVGINLHILCQNNMAHKNIELCVMWLMDDETGTFLEHSRQIDYNCKWDWNVMQNLCYNILIL